MTAPDDARAALAPDPVMSAHFWGRQVGRVWFEVSWHPGRRWRDLHGTPWSFTFDLWAFGLQGGIEARR